MNQKHLSRLAAALTDFQKAQCFFMLATNIAAQVVVLKGGLKLTSLQQIYNTYAFIRVIAISGFLPITFTLFTLHLLEMISWYLLLLSFCSVASSIITVRILGTFDPSPADIKDVSRTYSTGGPESCGFKQPSAFCFAPIEYDSRYVDSSNYSSISPGHSAYRMLSFCLVVWILLLIKKSRVWKRRIIRKLIYQSRSQSATSIRRLLNRTNVLLQRTIESKQSQSIVRRVSELQTYCLAGAASLMAALRWKVAIQPTMHRCTRSVEQRLTSLKQSDRYIIAKNTTWRFWVRSRANVFVYHKAANYKDILRKSPFIAVNIIFTGVYIHWFIIFFQDLGWFATNGYYNKDWNFGQIIAIAVWAPPVSEYIYLELCEQLPISCHVIEGSICFV